MRFLIQKIDKQVRHDFSFTLLESIRYQKWLQELHDEKPFTVKYVNCKVNDKVWFFKPFHEHYVPVGSVEFVLTWMKRFGVPTPNPINVPEELFEPNFAMRPIFNGNHMDLEDRKGKWFVKSSTEFKGFAEVLRLDDNHSWNIPAGHYQISKYKNVVSEWRAFVYQGKLVGLHNYSGIFSKFPDVRKILHMIHYYKSAPVAYTLDVAIDDFDNTFVIECHDFFSCGLYGFAEHKIYPYMLYRWFHEYLNKNNGTK